MKGTYVERDRKKEKKKIKGSDAVGAKKGAQGAGASMVAGVPAAMPVSGALVGVLVISYWTQCWQQSLVTQIQGHFIKYSAVTLSINVNREASHCKFRVIG